MREGRASEGGGLVREGLVREGGIFICTPSLIKPSLTTCTRLTNKQ